MVERFKRMLGLVSPESRSKLESLTEQSGAVSREVKEADEAIKEAESIIRMIQKGRGRYASHYHVKIGTMTVKASPQRLKTFKPGWAFTECTGYLKWLPRKYQGFCWELNRDVEHGPGTYLWADSPDLSNSMMISPLLLASPVDKLRAAKFLGQLVDKALDGEVDSNSDDIRKRVLHGDLPNWRNWS